MILAMFAVLITAMGVCLMIQSFRYSKRYDKTGVHGYFDDPAVWFLVGFVLCVMGIAFLF